MMIMLLTASVRASGPSQIHLAYGDQLDTSGYATSMAVSWFTDDAAASNVQWWQAGTAKVSSAVGTSTCYLEGSGHHHTAQMVGLTGSTQYTYRVGDATGWSANQTVTAPSQDPSEPFSMSIFGDWGWLDSKQRPMKLAVDGLKKTWDATKTRVWLEAAKNKGMYTSLWHLGDIGYADDAYAHDPLHFSYETAYNGFMNWIQNISATMPYMVSVGNHESECHSPACFDPTTKRSESLRNFSAYNARWNMPASSSQGVEAMWYSWNQGPVHFVSINTETDWPGAAEEKHGDSGILPAGSFGRDGEFQAWLEADLAAANASRTLRPWIVVGGHKPLGSISRTIFPPLLAKYGVDLYVAGHSHSYARSWPTRADGTTETHHAPGHYHASQGLAEVVVGGAGCEEMSDIGDAADAMLAEGAPVYATGKLATGVLNVLNKSAVQWVLYSSTNGDVLDKLLLTK